VRAKGNRVKWPGGKEKRGKGPAAQETMGEGRGHQSVNLETEKHRTKIVTHKARGRKYENGENGA